MESYALALMQGLINDQDLTVMEHVRPSDVLCPSCENGEHEQLIGAFKCDCPCHGQLEERARKLCCL